MNKTTNEQLRLIYDNASKQNMDDIIPGYRKLLEYNETVLAMKRFKDRGINHEFEFVTWQISKLGGVCWGHYTESFEFAKEDFVKRSGLVDAERIFDIEDLSLIHKGLLKGAYSPSIDLETREQMLKLAEKIRTANVEEMNLSDDENEIHNYQEDSEELEL